MKRSIPLLLLAAAAVVAALLVFAIPTNVEPRPGAGPEKTAPAAAAADGQSANADQTLGKPDAGAASTAPAAPNQASVAATTSATVPAGATVVPAALPATGAGGAAKQRGAASTPAAGNSGPNPGVRAAANNNISAASVPDVADLLASADLSIPGERQRIAALLQEHESLRMQGVMEKARAMGIVQRFSKPGGGVTEIVDFDGETPVYRTTFNRDAGISSGADVLRGAGFGNLTGQGLTVGVWDGGLVRPTHQEFSAGQVTLFDLDSVYIDHATHVAVTLAGIGFKPAAQGMAPRAKIDSYDWVNDYPEMTLVGAALPSGESGKIPISNHSYGIVFSPLSAGYYEKFARTIDATANALPYYLQFWAAGNSQKLQLNGYFTMSHYQLAKNIVTVGAVEDAVGTSGQRDTNNAKMSSFSSWGPANDGRIKPDLVANGVQVYSATSLSDQAYEKYDGTSMASPSAAGTSALLVDLYRREFGNRLPLAALLKAILIHSADDLGRPGPDYQFGWGLINGEKAGQLIREHKTTPRFFGGQVSTVARRWTHTFKVDAAGPVRATLVWADPAGVVRTRISRDPNLVHNLDLQIVGPGAVTNLPYVMPYVGNWTPAALTQNAIKGKNNVDNVERVDILPNAASGEYTLVVTADGAMTSSQDFSVVLTGAGTPINPSPAVNLQSPQSGDWFLPGRKIPMQATASDRQADGSPGSVTRVEFLVNGVSVRTNAVPPYEWSDWLPAAPGTYTVEAVATDNNGAKGYSSPAVVEVREPLPGEVHPAFVPPTADSAVFALAEDNQQRIYLGGLFTALNTNVPAQRLARLSRAGVVDTNYAALGAGPDDRVRALAVASDQKLLVGGDFGKVGTAAQRALARLNTDGSLDTAFRPAITNSAAPIKASVRALLVQPDGNIVVGGLFDRVNGVERRNIARLKPDGSLDELFMADASNAVAANGAVSALALQPDGKILLGGEFTAVNGATFNRLARINADGSLDNTLVLGTGQQTGFNGAVQAVAVDTDGSIYAGGAFTAYRGHPYHFNLVKLASDGALQGDFNFAPGLNGGVNGIVCVDKKALVSGAFTAVENSLLAIPPTNVGRVLSYESTGAIDSTFNVGGVGADGTVNRILRLSSGHFLVAGSFSAFNGVPRARLAMVAGLPPTDPVPAGTLVSRLRAESAAGEAVDFSLPSGVGEGGRFQAGGSLPRGLRFDPSTGKLIGVPLESGQFQISISSTDTNGQTRQSVLELSVEEAAVSYEQWQRAWFSDAEAHLAEPSQTNNAAGLSNLEVYAFSGGDPRGAAPDLLPQTELVPSGADRQIFWKVPTFRLANYGGASNVIYQPQVAAAPGGPWAPGEVVVDPGQLRIRAPGNPAAQFFRIKLMRP
jgi:uncharacterized delta-60 repeat protein